MNKTDKVIGRVVLWIGGVIVGLVLLITAIAFIIGFIEGMTQQVTGMQENITQKEKSGLEKLRDSLEESKQKMDVLAKVRECSKLCVDTDIPAVVDQMYMECYRAYYYGGESVLNKMIEACR